MSTVIDRAGPTGLYLFAFFALLGVAPANLGLTILLVATIAAGPRFIGWLRREPLAWLILAFPAYVVVRGLAGPDAGDTMAGTDWQAVKDWAVLGAVPLVAFWMQGREERVLRVLGIALAGFLIGRLLELDRDAIHNIVSWQGDPLGLKKLSVSAYAAIAGLGLLVYRRRWTDWLRARCGPGIRLGAYSGAALVGAFLLIIVITSFARGTWLALAIALPLVGIGTALPYLRRSTHRSLKRLAATGGVAVLILALVAAVAGERMYAQITSGSDAWNVFASGQWEKLGDLPRSSIRNRVQMQVQGLDWVGQAPLLGKGSGSVEALLASTDHLREHTDLHNTLLDAMVELGLIGAGLIVVFVGATWLALAGAFRTGAIAQDTFWFFTGAAVIYFVVALTNDRIHSVDGQFTWLLLMGGMLSLASLRSNPQPYPAPERGRDTGSEPAVQ